MVRLTDCPDITFTVDVKQQHNNNNIVKIFERGLRDYKNY